MYTTKKKAIFDVIIIYFVSMEKKRLRQNFKDHYNEAFKKIDAHPTHCSWCSLLTLPDFHLNKIDKIIEANI